MDVGRWNQPKRLNQIVFIRVRGVIKPFTLHSKGICLAFGREAEARSEEFDEVLGALGAGGGE